MQNLKICKASAGSGKTFTLAVEYIKHLIINPMSYRHILAVTFTNKATLEMKQRILSQLYGLSRGLKDSDSYMDALKKALDKMGFHPSGKIEQVIRERCSIALSEIIHNYHRFRIETIDSFFQSIVRELAHDLDLTANLRVDLDNDHALEEGVKTVIDEFVYDKDIQVRILKYVKERMDANRNWNITSEMQIFGKNIFNEKFLEHGEELRKKLNEPNFINDIQSKIELLRTNALNDIHGQSKVMLNIIDAHGFSKDDFKQKTRGIYSFFITMSKSDNFLGSNGYISPNKYVTACLESPENWSDSPAVRLFVEDENMISRLENYMNEFSKVKTTVISCDLVLKNLNNLSLINIIDKKVQIVTSNRNDFLLANTNHFLSRMISDSDVPFIYERTGTRFDHIMIDEFQDTSGLQWKNFKPLIQNSLSANHECMLVGDVKQSIYRWRNSEWSILNNISHESAFSKDVNDMPLSVNYRSKGRIVSFNNDFFTNAASIMSDEYSRTTESTSDDINVAYGECVQELPNQDMKHEGYVRIELQSLAGSDSSEESVDDASLSIASTNIDTETVANDTESDLNANDLWECRRVANNVKDLLSQGVDPNDICILIRKKKFATIICSYFDQYVSDEDGKPIKIVSSEVYELRNSPSLNILMWTLRVLASPDDHMAHCMLAYHYQTDVLENHAYKEDLNKVLLLTNEELDKLLPEEFTSQLEKLEIVPLYELCERIYHIFQLDRLHGQDSYLFAFFDYLTDYLESNTSNLDRFISYWEDTLSTKTISNESQDGIRIMTIHKSKGLEFHSVIVPFCSWDIVKSKDLIWCVNHKEFEPYNELPLVPVTNSEKLSHSVFASDSREEYLKTFVDNMNLMYVAFTRASRNLIIISGNDSSAAAKIYKDLNKNHSPSLDQVLEVMSGSAKPTKDISQTIITAYDLLLRGRPETMEIEDDTDKGSYIITYNAEKILPSKLKDKQQSENVFEENAESRHVAFHSGPSRAEFRQSNESQRFVNGEDTASDGINYQDEGLIFHEILSHIRTEDDVDREIARMEFEGRFADGCQRERVKRLVKKAFLNEYSKGWFDPRWTVINEQSILYRDADGKVVSRRPDRVITDGKETIVIDYKTGSAKDEYDDQVRLYMQLLTDMGLPNVKGYIWYIRKEAIYEIDN